MMKWVILTISANDSAVLIVQMYLSSKKTPISMVWSQNGSTYITASTYRQQFFKGMSWKHSKPMMAKK
jgi:hypothetical protein